MDLREKLGTPICNILDPKDENLKDRNLDLEGQDAESL